MLETRIQHIPRRCTWIIGVDEAGRGPVAGPVSIGIAMIKRKDLPGLLTEYPKLKDSKKLSPSKREELLSQALSDEQLGKLFARTVLVPARAIDERGISVCIKEAITNGITELLEFTGTNQKHVFVHLDGALRGPVMLRQQTTIGGDNKIFSIALASIYAKTSRDKAMEHYDLIYPQYGFYTHKGYGTAEHMKRIKECGVCPIHRKTYLKKYL